MPRCKLLESLPWAYRAAALCWTPSRLIGVLWCGAGPDLSYADDWSDTDSYYTEDAVTIAGTGEILYQTYQPKWCVRRDPAMLAAACMPAKGAPERLHGASPKDWGVYSHQ